MGLDISNILEKRSTSLEELAGKTLAIDAFNTLYQFITTIRQPDGTPLMDSRGRITSHLTGLFYRSCNLLEKGINPVFVFDGKPNELKRRTLDQRAAAKQEAKVQMLQAMKEGDVERAGQLAQRTAKLETPQVDQSKELLTYLGIPWVQAASEGEAQCAHLAKEGLVDAAASQDYDTLLFGAPLLIRNLTISGKKKIPRRNMSIEIKPEEISLEHNLSTMGITREKLIWLGILNGTDFNAGIYGIGPKKALKLVQKHDTFEEVLKEIDKEIEWQPVFELFEKPPIVNVEKTELQQKEPQRDKIIKMMVEDFEFSQERVENALKRAYKEPEDASQSQLKKWF